MKPKPTLVVWRDAYGIDEQWIPGTGYEFDNVIVTTVGFIVPDGPVGYVTIADSTYVTGGQRWYGGITVVPVEMVIERRTLT